jgi:hypothetical protein
MRFSLSWIFAAMLYVALATTAIWHRSIFCATLLFVGIAFAFFHTMFGSFVAQGEERSKAMKWGASGCLSIFGLCLGLWFASTLTDTSDFDLSFGIAQLTVSDGSVVICDSLSNLEIIELLDSSVPFSPTPQGKYGFSVPGLSARCITFADSDQPIWSWRMSLLIPAGIAITAAVFFTKKCETRSQRERRKAKRSQRVAN